MMEKNSSPTPIKISEEIEKASERNGYRRFFRSNNYFYRGNWKDDKFHGTGTLKCIKRKSGYVYEGEFKEGHIHGMGSLYKSAPGKDPKKMKLYYEGSFANGYPSGAGHLRSDKEGSDYHGEIRCGKRHGLGKAYYDKGAFYYGYWKNNKREGKGYCIYENDNCYEGSWFNDVPHGFGVFIFFRKGVAQEGVWVGGECKTSEFRVIECRQSERDPIVYTIPKVCLLHHDNASRNWQRKAEDVANSEMYKILGMRLLKKQNHQ